MPDALPPPEFTPPPEPASEPKVVEVELEETEASLPVAKAMQLVDLRVLTKRELDD